MGVGAEVDAARVAAIRHARADRQDGHERRRGERAHPRPDPYATDATEAPQPEQEQRPDEVELLLDGQRPQVLEHRRSPRGLEVGLAVQDVPPVGGVDEGRDGVLAHTLRRILGDGHRQQRRADQYKEERREESLGASLVEAPELDASGVAKLTEEQRRDEKPGEGEEDVDAEEAARQPVWVGVEEEHRRDRDRPHSVEPGHVRPTACTGRLGRMCVQSSRSHEPSQVEVEAPGYDAFAKNRSSLTAQ